MIERSCETVDALGKDVALRRAHTEREGQGSVNRDVHRGHLLSLGEACSAAKVAVSPSGQPPDFCDDQ
jgi:hypothetical protein